MVRRQILACAISVLAFGNAFAKDVAKTESEAVAHAWLLPMCPSEYQEAKLDTLLTGILVTAADNVIDRLGTALNDAAKADKEGDATKGISPGYLWWNDKKEEKRKLMSCVVVTLSNSGPNNWCSKSLGPFVETIPACGYFQDSKVAALTNAHLQPASWEESPTPPKLYAEIKLEASADLLGVLPELVALYYPNGIHTQRSKFRGAKPRTLQLNVAAATPDGANALSAIVVRLDAITPTNELRMGDKLPPTNGRVWAAPLAIPGNYVTPNTTGPIIPVNISTEIREIGDPNRFLQALAAAFASQKDALKERVNSQITSVTAEVDSASLQSAYDVQAATVYAAEANLRGVCKPAQSGTRDPSAVRNAYLVLLEAHRKLDALPKPNKVMPFSPDMSALEALRQSDAAAICAKF